MKKLVPEKLDEYAQMFKSPGDEITPEQFQILAGALANIGNRNFKEDLYEVIVEYIDQDDPAYEGGFEILDSI